MGTTRWLAYDLLTEPRWLTSRLVTHRPICRTTVSPIEHVSLEMTQSVFFWGGVNFCKVYNMLRALIGLHSLQFGWKCHCQRRVTFNI